jgi:hypothetical protein
MQQRIGEPFIFHLYGLGFEGHQSFPQDGDEFRVRHSIHLDRWGEGIRPTL